MGLPKRKTNIQVYREKTDLSRRQELLDQITKADSYLPDSILHDDLDRGMLDYVKKTFVIVSDNKQIPFIDKILTIQRWAELSKTWQYTNEDGNIEIPFICIVRKPEVNLGTNPAVQRTIPDRHQFYYASVPTWNGTQMGADIYTIPQPIAVDIVYDVTIVCGKLRDLNKFNRKVLQHFASVQDYTTVKGHYIPIVLNNITDNTPMETLDNRRFYSQSYQFTMLGFLIDSDEFQVKPAISRAFTMFEFIKDTKFKKQKISDKNNIIQTVQFVADGIQTQFSVGESIGILFDVKVNNNLQTLNSDYFHIAYTSNVNFNTPPADGSIVVIQYYKGRNQNMLSNDGKILQFTREEFIYTGTEPMDGSGNPIYTVQQIISQIVTVEINGLAEQENIGYELLNDDQINLLGKPLVGSKIGISYLY